MTDKAPNAWKMEQAMSALMSARQRVAEDGELIDDATGEILDITRVEQNATDLLHATLRAASYAEAMAAGIKEMMDKLKARQDRYKARAEAYRGAAFAAMDVLELPRVELPDLTASIARGTPQVVITDETALPEHCVRVIPEQRAPDRVTIAANLKAGIPVPGAELSNSLPRLMIKKG